MSETERQERIKQLYGEALEHDASERAAFLTRACADDEALRREVESLLSYESEALQFIEAPALKVAAEMLAEEQLEAKLGRQLGAYKIIARLGAGGMGEVWLAEDTRLRRKVALKLLPARFTADAERVRRFKREARAVSALNHPNILTIYEIGQAAPESDAIHFIATEYVEGQTLRQRLQQAPMSVAEALETTTQIANALVAAHAAGIVHRDIKPENVMLRPDGYVKVLDFGLARMTQRETLNSPAGPTQSIQTDPGLVMGTVGYMSPEQVRGAELDARTDIFSLGVTLYEMLAGNRPFKGATTADVIVALLEKDPPPLSHSLPGVPDELQQIVTRALAKEPAQRYQTAQALLTELKRLNQRLEQTVKSSLAASATANDATGLTTNLINPVAGTEAAKDTPDSAPTTSSAEFLFNKFMRYKRGATTALAALLVGIIMLGYGIYHWLPKAPAELPVTQRALTQLTFGAGLQSEPTWSPDGRFIAYSSDRGGNFDIWVQQVSGGDAHQVTKSPAHDWQPDWSPDGNSLVFRSEREGGGLFVVPVLGGHERKISSFGYRPQWSPDSTQVLFYNSNLQNVTAPPKIYVVSLDAAPPREVLAALTSEFPGRLRVAWHPDGQRVSLLGEHRKVGLSFWTVSLAGGAPVRSEFSPRVAEQIKAAGVDLFDFRWARTERALFFEGIARGVRNLWKIAVEPSGLRWTNGPERLTTGAGLDTDITLSPDGRKLAFTTRSERTRLWSLPFNAATGQTKGAGQAVTPPGLNALGFDLTRDGKQLAFIVQRAEKRELWAKSLADGSEKLLVAADDFVPTAPRWSRAGSRLAYARNRLPSAERSQQYTFTFEHAISLLNADGGEQGLTSPHILQGWPWDWSADQTAILGSSARQTPGQWGLYLFPLVAAPQAETQMRLVTARPEYDAFNARFSPDERWVCFIGVNRTDLGDAGIYAIPAQGGEWVRLSESNYYADKPRWAPDGRTIYFLSDRSGFFNVWGRRFDPAAGRTVGEAFRVTSYESPAQMIPPAMTEIELALAAERLVVPIMEVAGSIWILENVDR